MTAAPRTAARLLLGSAMVGAGVLHLTTQRQEFQAQVPSWFPVDEDLTVLGSGVAEIALGAAFVAFPRHRRLIGGLLAAFFVVIFPGNVAQYLEGTDAFGLDTDRKRLVRLFFQPLLVLWALYGGGLLRRARAADARSVRRGRCPVGKASTRSAGQLVVARRAGPLDHEQRGVVRRPPAATAQQGVRQQADRLGDGQRRAGRCPR